MSKLFHNKGKKTPVRSYFIICGLLFLFMFADFSRAGEPVRVGIYDFEPLVYRNEDGKPAGIYVDILEEIADRENWDLTFVYGTWPECLDRLEKDQLDILTGILRSPEREKKYSFSSVSLLSTWGQLYAGPEVKVENLLDLDGKSIAVVEGGYFYPELKHKFRQFDINAHFVKVQKYTRVFELLEEGKVVAGSAERVTGLQAEGKYNIHKTPLIYNRQEFLFAAPEGKTEILRTIDKYLEKFKNREGSVYERALQKHLHQTGIGQAVPGWMIWMLGGLIGICLLTVATIYYLRKLIREKTVDLRKKEAMLARSQSIGQVGSWVYDVEEDYLRWSDETYRIFGLQPQEFRLTLDSFLEYVHPEDRPKTKNAYLDSVDEGEPGYEIQHRILRDDNGEVRYVYEKCENEFDEDGQVIRSVGMVQDITERKRAEQSLKYRLEFEERISAASNQFINCSPEEFDQRVHKTLASIGEFVGVDRSYFFQLHDEKRLMSNTHEWCAEGVSPQKGDLQNLLSENFPWVIRKLTNSECISLSNLDELPPEAETAREHLESQNITSLILVPVLIKNELVGFIGFDTVGEETQWSSDTISLLQTTGEILTNALQRHRFQKELEQAHEELKEKQQQLVEQERHRALSTMASGIAHDFNNALSTIKGYTDMLLESDEKLEDSDTVARCLEHVSQSASNAAETVRRMRNFYRLSEDEEYEPVELNEVIEGSISMTQPRWKDQARAEGAEVEVEKDLEDIPPVRGIQAELHEVLTNLIFNAVDAMPEGGTLSFKTRQEDGEVALEVRDTGGGMPEEVRLHCFDPFYTTKQDAGGSGLGLSTVQAIVKRHDGRISVESEEGEGTAFRIVLAVSEDVSGDGEEEPETRQHQKELQILVAEDDDQQRYLISEYLSGFGHRTDLVPNGRVALATFVDGHYDLVITDSSMPEMGGEQLARKVKEKAPEEPVIMLTGFGDIMTASGDTPDGVDIVLSKPIDAEELQKAIAQVTGKAT